MCGLHLPFPSSEIRASGIVGVGMMLSVITLMRCTAGIFVPIPHVQVLLVWKSKFPGEQGSTGGHNVSINLEVETPTRPLWGPPPEGGQAESRLQHRLGGQRQARQTGCPHGPWMSRSMSGMQHSPRGTEDSLSCD